MSAIDKPTLVERLSLGVGALALAALFWPVAPRVIPRPLRTPEAAPMTFPADAARADSVREQIVTGNLFSASRRAPRERFVAPGSPSSSLSDPLPSSEPVGLDGDAGPQLFGILSIDGAPRALLQVAADSAPRLVAEGARIGVWRVRRIATDRVELSSSSGTRVVRLSRRTPPDSAEKLP